MTEATPQPIQRLLWSRVSWRHARGAPWTTALLVLTLALGVAVYLSIRLANRAAIASFQNFTDVVTAESDGILLAPAGSLPESLLLELRERFADTAGGGPPVQAPVGGRASGCRARARLGSATQSTPSSV